MCGVHSSFFVCWEGRTAWQYCGKSRQCNSLEQNFRSSSDASAASGLLSLLAFDCAPRVSAGNGQSVGFLVSLGRPLHKVPIRPRNPKLGVCPHLKHGGRHLRQSLRGPVLLIGLPSETQKPSKMSDCPRTSVVHCRTSKRQESSQMPLTRPIELRNFATECAAAISCNMHKPS